MSSSWESISVIVLFLVASSLALTVPSGCNRDKPTTLRLGVTTSVRDSGLLDQILPKFEEQHSANVNVIASGTGAILELARKGEIDVMIVHSKKDELEFVVN